MAIQKPPTTPPAAMPPDSTPDQSIVGYRELDEYETMMINEIKSKAQEVHALIERAVHCGVSPDPRWVAIARTHLQQGFMALTRSIAKPTSF